MLSLYVSNNSTIVQEICQTNTTFQLLVNELQESRIKDQLFAQIIFFYIKNKEPNNNNSIELDVQVLLLLDIIEQREDYKRIVSENKIKEEEVIKELSFYNQIIEKYKKNILSFISK